MGDNAYPRRTNIVSNWFKEVRIDRINWSVDYTKAYSIQHAGNTLPLDQKTCCAPISFRPSDSTILLDRSM